MIKFQFNRVIPQVNRTNNNVLGWVIGLYAIDEETNENSYIDTFEPTIEPYKILSEWTEDEIRNFCLQVANKYDWYNKLTEQIEAKNSQPKYGNNINI